MRAVFPTPKSVTAVMLSTVLLCAGPIAASMDFSPSSRESVVTPHGVPASDYWQQHVEYVIEATLDERALTLSGAMTITYTNNSDMPLHYLWMHLDGNISQTYSRGKTYDPMKSTILGGTSAGVEIHSINVMSGNESYAPETVINDTRMRVGLAEPVPPAGGQIRLQISWTYHFTENVAFRTGVRSFSRGKAYYFSYWHPRMAVFDRNVGWDTTPYLPAQNFYSDFSDFEVTLTVPASMLVFATGTLANEAEILPPPYYSRMLRSRSSAERLSIVSNRTVVAADDRVTKTWRYTATNVRSFAWCASAAFNWDALNWNGHHISVVYPDEGISEDPKNPGWESMLEVARDAIAHFSTTYFAYSYPSHISVAGLNGGMEHPGISFTQVERRGELLINTFVHEIAHQWVPISVNTHEPRFNWLDEGFTTFMDYYYQLEHHDKLLAHYEVMQSSQSMTEALIANHKLPPVVVDIEKLPALKSMEQLGSAIDFTQYLKPAYGYVLLRERVLGPERFDFAFSHFLKQWRFKAPYPEDFFAAFENAAGEDLTWFWENWLYKNTLLDHSIEQVTETRVEGSDDYLVTIALQNLTGLRFPTHVKVIYENGRSRTYPVPSEFWWQSGANSLRMVSDAPVRSVTLDPQQHLPDINRANDVWPRSQ
jgi:hypothetical protein